jgi:uncharacterized protein YdhG (YjbR/CyaY superfamily)
MIVGMSEGSDAVDAYIATFPADVAERLEVVRAAIHRVLPDGEERVRYGIAAVMIDHRNAIHFAGWKKHIGLYPVPRAEGELEAAIAPYRAAKDSVNLPFSEPVPVELVERIASHVAGRYSS